MISSKRFESVDGATNRFLSDFIIQSELHCRVYMYKYNPSCALDTSCNTIVGGVYVRELNNPQSADIITVEKWDLVDNSIVFYTTPSNGVTIVIEVATTPEEFGDVVALPSVLAAQSYAASATASALSATASALSATASETSATASALSALNSKNSATASATSAATSATTATIQASTATTKATEASASALSASNNAASSAADVLSTHADVVTTTTQAGNSLASATLAQKWASELENVIVLGGLYSAYHWALKAAASAASFLGFSVTTPIMDSVGAVGIENTAARGDHVHPSDTSKANQATTYTKTETDTADNLRLLLAGGTMTGAITALRETKVAMGANDINLASGNLFTKTISGITTLTVSNWLVSGNANSFILELTNGGSAVVTWFAGVKWASGIAPSLTAAGVDILGFYSHDGGTTVRGIVLSKDSK